MDPNAMNVDDPNSRYSTPFIQANSDLAQRDSYTLACVLQHLANADPSCSRAVNAEEIEKLNMIDLRPLLASGQFASVGRIVLERISLSPTAPAVTEGGRSGLWLSATETAILTHVAHSAVVNAFKSTYQGSTVAIRKAIDQVINDRRLYANAIPFVQSSGTGKSRLMVELGQDCYVLMLNLREDDPAGTFSFPQSDRTVRQYFQDMEFTTDIAKNWRLRCAAFLCGIFTVLSTILDESVSSPSEFAKKLEKHRSAVISHVIQRSKEFEERFRKQYNDAKIQHETVICSAVTDSTVFQNANAFFAKLRAVDLSDPSPPFILVLDEAHVLTTRAPRSPVHGTLLDLFTSVLADLKQLSPDWASPIHFATVFLSTNTELNRVASSVPQIVSNRSHFAPLAGVLTFIAFDVFLDHKDDWTVAEISTLEFISTFGRPLFAALIKAGLPAEHALSLAERKLAHANHPFSIPILTEHQTAFALLSRRILLQFRPLQSSATTMASNLIARHLLVAHVVPKHRRFVVSGSPSEPFIIEAAARMMATPGFSTIRCLLNLANEDLISAGESGEIVGRSLTIDAYDFALRYIRSGPKIYHSWVPVLDFLRALFSDGVYEQIIKIKPYQDPEGQTLENAFENAVVRLTHYVRLSQLSLLTAANVRKAFLRGMGLVGAESKSLIDILLPILLVDGKEPQDWRVDEAKMSHIFANWKNKATDATPPHSDPYDTYPELNTELPTIFMWHQFASKRSEAITPQAENIHHPGRKVYFIDLYGIGPEVYREVKLENQGEYLQFIGCEDMYRDAPYTFKEYIDSVECTKPRWSAKSFEETIG